ncbi:MAG: phosphonopyruvate decarboxylase [Nanoarchaeota archaeon]|nr:phosphonopyruvate decarboxylase [Nanoarchaeota archaeon]MBU1005593.1 phosphonopyruvate decarboxylase [Nanoarchaeota archaeon]MBU1945979.1 phosphonopyruvate decarboxylase [Nanoarchaeota archaeon]
MISCEKLYEIFKKNELTFFTGVPDSIFKDWMKFLADEHGGRVTNIIACNECEAVATAAGYNLATGKIGVVYMQNSGEGKTVNPLTSLCDKEVYSIPVLLMIGWRGEPGKKDEPQHKKMGRITINLLETLEIPYEILPTDEEDIVKSIAKMKELAEQEIKPVALIVRSGILKEYESKKKVKTNYEMAREDAIKSIVDNLDGSEPIVSTTGKTSRELFEYRVAKGQKPCDFYTVGSMGCCVSIANGIALQKPSKKVFVFDGDGAVIMQMGALATVGHYRPKNLYHIVFDNGSYDSTGGQPTVSVSVDFGKAALACGYKAAKTVEKKADLIQAVNEMRASDGPQMLIVKVNKGARKDLGRPTTTPVENKKEFMKKL